MKKAVKKKELRTITLRIKRIWYDLIKSGEKKIEYRECKPFYDALFNEKADILKLHYQGKFHLLVEIKKIRKIKTPKKIVKMITDLGMDADMYIYAIYLGKIIKQGVK